MHEIRIRKVWRGYIAQVGCREIVYSDSLDEVRTMQRDLGEYLENPQAKEKEMCAKEGEYKDALALTQPGYADCAQQAEPVRSETIPRRR